MKYILTTTLSIFLLTGCSISKNPDSIKFIEHQNKKEIVLITHKGKVMENRRMMSSESHITSTVLNENFLVTVKHFPALNELSNVCFSDTLDLAFIKRENSLEKTPRWNHAQYGETLYLSGYSFDQRNKKETFESTSGIHIESRFEYRGSYGYKVVETEPERTIKQGMSGGPAKNSNGEIVGINIGFTNSSLSLLNFNPNKRYNLFLSYESILEESKIIEQKFKNGKC